MIHLDFVTGGVRALVEAIQSHDAQADKPEKDRDPHQVARTVDSAYLATDRWLKALVSATDPYLLLSEPNRTLLHTLRAAMVNNESPSMFTCGVKCESLKATETAKLLPTVIRPKVSDESHGAFVAALKAVAQLRNDVQHGELYGDGDELLAAAKRLLAELYVLGKELTPQFLSAASALNAQTVSRLKAYKEDVDAAWQVVLDYLDKQQRIELGIHVYVYLVTPDSPLSVLVSGEALGRDAILAHLEIPASDAAGLFRQQLSGEEEDRRLFLRALGEALVSPPTVGLLGSSIPSGAEASQSKEPAPVRGVGKLADFSALRFVKRERVITPLEDGALRIALAPGRLSIHMADVTKGSFVSASVVLDDWQFAVLANNPSVQLDGLLKSGRTTGSSAGDSLFVSGALQMDAEWVMREPAEGLNLPAGTVARSFSGTVTITRKVGSG